MSLRVRVQARGFLRLDEVRCGDGLAALRDLIGEPIDERPVERVSAVIPVLAVLEADDPVDEAARIGSQAQLLAKLLLLEVLAPVVVGRGVAVVVVEAAIREVVERADGREHESVKAQFQVPHDTPAVLILMKRQPAGSDQLAARRTVEASGRGERLGRNQRLDVRGRRRGGYRVIIDVVKVEQQVRRIAQSNVE